MVIQRIGREAVLEQAVRDSLPHWYEQALLQAEVSTVGDPELNLEGTCPPQAGSEPLQLLDRGLGDAEGSSSASTPTWRSARREPEVPGEGDRRGARAPA